MLPDGNDSSDVDADDDAVATIPAPAIVSAPTDPLPLAAETPGSVRSEEGSRIIEPAPLGSSESESKLATSTTNEKDLPPEVVEAVTRYVTFKVRKLPKVDLLGKTNPILAVWDSVARAIVGTTEWVKGHCSADFQEVIAVKHYPGIGQDLHINIFNTSTKQIRPKDFLGKAIIQTDLLAASAGNEVRVALFNEKDPKMDLWLKKRMSCVLIHTKDPRLTAGVLKSGYVLTREIAVGEAPTRRASMFSKDKPASSASWRKRFVVATRGELAHFDCVKDFFVAEAPCVRLDLARDVSLDDSVAVGKSLVDHRREAWQVVIHNSGRAHEFDLVREEPSPDSLKPPTGERRVRSSSDAGFAFGGGTDVQQTADKSEWLRAIAIAMPYKVFGVPLAVAASRSDEEKLVPAPVRIATTWMNAHALREEGLYRIPGSKSEVDRLIKTWDQGEKVVIPEQYSGGNLASVVVQFLRRLPDSIVTDRLAAVFNQVCQELVVDDSKKFMLKKLMSKLPPQNFCTLKMLTDHFVQVAAHSEDNHMTLEKLAMCAFSQSPQVIQMLCHHHEFVFDQVVPVFTAPEHSS